MGMGAPKCGNGSTKVWEWKHQSMGMEAPKCGNGSIKVWEWEHQIVGKESVKRDALKGPHLKLSD